MKILSSHIFIMKVVFLAFTVLLGTLGVPFAVMVEAAFNPQINYQGKLADTDGTTVADGTYAMVFKLYTTASGGAAIWTETRSGANEVDVAKGLFSVMLGEVTALTGIDWNQTLYLGVTIESDSEMTPRKKLGAVPAAFVADTLDGLESSQFIRSDTANATNTTNTALIVTQNGTGDLLNLFDGATEAFTVLDGGNVGIGTTSPWAKLSVSQTGGGSDPIFTIASSTSGAATTTVFHINAIGNVGIGTTTPSGRLAIKGVDAGSVSGVYPLPALYVFGGNGGSSVNGPASTSVYMIGGTGGNGSGTGGFGGDLEFYGGMGGSGSSASRGGHLYLAGGNPSTGTSLYGSVLLGVDKTGTIRGNIGIGTSTPGARLSVGSGDAIIDGFVKASYFTSTSTATSTFAGAISLRGAHSASNVALGFGVLSNTGFYDNSSGGIGFSYAGTQVASFGAGSNQYGIQAMNNNVSGRALDVTQSNSSGHGLYVTAAQNYFTGSLGIGTTTPAFKLSVGSGDALIDGFVKASYFLGTSTATSTLGGGLQTTALNVTGSATSTFAQGINLAAGCFAVNGTCVGGGGSGSGTVNSGTQGQAAFYDTTGTAVSGTSTLFISQTSAVGVGTTNPHARLTVVATSSAGNSIAFSVKNSTGDGTFKIDGSGTITMGPSSAPHSIITNMYDTSLSIASADGLIYLGNEASNQTLYFLNSGGATPTYITTESGSQFTGTLKVNDTSGIELFTVNATTGNVGVGTSSPYSKLSVNGQIVGANFISTTTATSSFMGAIGIGTTSPSAKLHITSETSGSQVVVQRAPGSGTNQPAAFEFRGTDGSNNNASIQYLGGFGGTPEFVMNPGLIVKQGTSGLGTGADLFSVLQSTGNVVVHTGNLGIGTTSPYAKLSVNGQAVAAYFTATSTTATSTFNGGFIAGYDTNVSAFPSLLVLKPGDQFGLVGIGTSTPAAPLVVENKSTQGSSDGYTAAIFASKSTLGAGIVLQSNFGTAKSYALRTTTSLGGINTGSFAISNLTDGTHPFVLTSEGNLGIGTTSPYARLSVSGQVVAAYFTATTTTATSTFAGDVIMGDGVDDDSPIQVGVDSNAWTFGYKLADKSFRIASSTDLGSNVELTILKGGNVGLGDTSPDFALDVYGTICQDTDSNDTCDGTPSSDIRLKQDILTIDGSLDMVRQLRGVRFNWRQDIHPASQYGTSTQIGFIAQEVETVLPEVIYHDMLGYKMIDYQKLTAVLANAVGELDKKVNLFASSTATSSPTSTNTTTSSSPSETRSEQTTQSETGTNENLNMYNALASQVASTSLRLDTIEEVMGELSLRVENISTTTFYFEFGTTTSTTTYPDLNSETIVEAVASALTDLFTALANKVQNFSQIFTNKMVALVAAVGDLFVSKIVIIPDGELNVPRGRDQIAGTGVIKAGQTEVFITNSQADEFAMISITPTSPVQSPLYVSYKKTGEGFAVRMMTPLQTNTTFDWFLVKTYDMDGEEEIFEEEENIELTEEEEMVESVEGETVVDESVVPNETSVQETEEATGTTTQAEASVSDTENTPEPAAASDPVAESTTESESAQEPESEIQKSEPKTSEPSSESGTSETSPSSDTSSSSESSSDSGSSASSGGEGQ